MYDFQGTMAGVITLAEPFGDAGQINMFSRTDQPNQIHITRHIALREPEVRLVRIVLKKSF